MSPFSPCQQALLASLHGTSEMIIPICAPIITGKTKELRSKLVRACALLLGSMSSNHEIFGHAIEALHTASLLHDDVLDRAQTRREQLCIHHSLGLRKAILGGDFLFAQSFSWLVSLENLDVLKMMDKTLKDLICGQIEEGSNALSMEAYLTIAEKKTASLFVAACGGAALLSNRPDLQASFGEFGRCFGLVFQILDDLSEYEMGGEHWTVGHDFVEGKATLPWILAHQDDPVGLKQQNKNDCPKAQIFFKPYVEQGHKMALDLQAKAWEKIVSSHGHQALEDFKKNLEL